MVPVLIKDIVSLHEQVKINIVQLEKCLGKRQKHRLRFVHKERSVPMLQGSGLFKEQTGLCCT